MFRSTACWSRSSPSPTSDRRRIRARIFKLILASRPAPRASRECEREVAQVQNVVGNPRVSTASSRVLVIGNSRRCCSVVALRAAHEPYCFADALPASPKDHPHAMFHHASTLLLVLFATTGCGSIPTPERLEAAQIGPAPSKDEAVLLASAVLRQAIPTYATAKVGFDDLKPGFYKVGAGDAGHRYAWDLVAWVEATDAQGVRSPAQRHHIFFLGNMVVATAHPNTRWNGRGYESWYDIEELNGGGLDHYGAKLRKPPEPKMR